MNETSTIIAYAGLLAIALFIIKQALGQAKKLALLVIILFIVCSATGYWQWGSWQRWHDFQQRQAQQQKLKALLATVKSPEDLARQLRHRLDDSPQSARGWYLLGRLYAGQGHWQAAYEAFAKAKILNPQDELTLVNYAQSLWQLNNQQLNNESQTILHNVLQKNPRQPDALALLAIDAYKQNQFNQAINYWRQLLQLIPQQSEDAHNLRKMIAKAQQQL